MNYQPIQTISLGSLVIQVWGMFLALAIGLSLVWAYYRTPKELRDDTLNLGIINILAGVVGARLAFVILYPESFERVVDIFKIWTGGMVSYGGFVLAIFLSIAYLRKRKRSIYQFADIFAPPLALATVITRIGCFLNHCHLGKTTDLPWGLKYLGEIRHPIALYYVLSTLIILIVLIVLERRYQLKSGVLGLSLGSLYPLFRLIVDQFASYQPEHIATLNNIFLVLLFLLFGYMLRKGLQERS